MDGWMLGGGYGRSERFAWTWTWTCWDYEKGGRGWGEMFNVWVWIYAMWEKGVGVMGLELERLGAGLERFGGRGVGRDVDCKGSGWER